MCKEAIKEVDTTYKFARLNAARYNDKLKSREGAAELLYINPTTLARYELGTLNVSNEMALLMSEIYNAPELIPWYCKNECGIGRNSKFEIEVKELPITVLQFKSKMEKSRDYANTLIAMYEDGVLDNRELEELSSIREKVLEVQVNIADFILSVDKLLVSKQKARHA